MREEVCPSVFTSKNRVVIRPGNVQSFMLEIFRRGILAPAVVPPSSLC